jgi:hypothetical protein
MPALVAIVRQPHLLAFYEHLLARGKTKMQALVAALRKLLHAIYGMFKHDQFFDVYAPTPKTDRALPPTPPNAEVLCPQT